MKKFLLLSAAAILAGLAGFWAGQHFQKPQTAVETAAGKETVSFSLPDVGDHRRNISDWQGKVRVVNFWATWCPPCREEIPTFISLQKRLGARGLQIIGVAVDKSADVIPFYAAEKMNYPVLLGEQDGLELMARYGDPDGSLPYSLVLNAKGEVIAHKLGAFSRSELEQLLEPYLRKAS